MQLTTVKPSEERNYSERSRVNSWSGYTLIIPHLAIPYNVKMISYPTHFRDANYNDIPYDGFPVSWRVSIYGFCFQQQQQLLIVKHRAEKFWDIPGGG